ncbi:Zn-dependent peptidase ImmA, M78 family [Marinospirillum celere]|uniref:Zn-dependent peptidase ImmA, M78 family n=1 Tax=Marinospirillum celere TaxID=1122252 RepID=A0A1I1IAY5_9GAMM|nr:XRE family transcriptional regulator [Marinospirillum celere]SFC33225.1 Zn-dependent peptidase ImmA, M78 family [Marinospirillum celere]
MIGERILRARKAAGLSLRALADQIGVSQTTINKYEKGNLVPSSGQLIKLSKALSVRSEYFFRPVKVELKGVEYRKRSTTPKKILAQIEADVLDQAERWTSLVSLYPKAPVKKFASPQGLPKLISQLTQIEAVANTVREAWELGLNPIPDMIDMLESRGILVIVTSIEVNQKLDGLAASVNGTPVIVVSKHWPGDRQRFTLAHELGHLLLHGRLDESIDEEKACNRFAGAFLLPQKSTLQRLGGHRSHLEPQELYMLKHEFGLSMMGCLIRANQCKIISDAEKQKMIRIFSSKGWRTKEPGDPYPCEETYLYRQLVYRALAEDYLAESKAAELLCISTSALRKERKLGGMDATATDQ